MIPFDPRHTPWSIDESDFYEIEDPQAQKKFILQYAVLAPSGHNTQPWSFRTTPEGIEVYADYERRLPVSDPENRELLISVGAAITNLRVAAAHFGFDSTVLYERSPAESTPVALVALLETCNPDEKLSRLFESITRRHSAHAGFDRRQIEPEALEALCAFVESTESMRFVVPQERARVIELVEEGDRALMADERWRAELADWVRPNDSGEGDGISGDAFGLPGPISAMAPWLIRNLNVSEQRGKRDRELVDQAAGLIAITGDDDPPALIRTGETLEHLLLFLTSLGLQYAFVNQPVQVAALRRELWTLIRTPRPPQVMIRIGYGASTLRPMPRRPLEAVTR